MTKIQRADLSDIQHHYDSLSALYGRWWGDHIHHGYWEGEEEPAAAQEKLIEKLAIAAGISFGDEVLDVGCGLGGSSIWLAKRFDCRVHGITISPVQAKIAAARAGNEGLGKAVTFDTADANHLRFPFASFDAIWAIECIEHLYDKGRFFDSCSRMVRPGGKLAICTWLAHEDPDAEQSRLLEQVCHGMICPALASMEDHLEWLRASGFQQIAASDLTANVKKTWDRTARIVQRPELQAILRVSPQRTRDFANAFPLMQQAYATEAMRYGMFTARLSE